MTLATLVACLDLWDRDDELIVTGRSSLGVNRSLADSRKRKKKKECVYEGEDHPTARRRGKRTELLLYPATRTHGGGLAAAALKLLPGWRDLEEVRGHGTAQ